MAETLVSIVIPVRDRRDCVMDAVQSALAQTHENIECIVVDDGSSDGSGDLVSSSTSDPRVNVQFRDHAGVSAARNAGIASAKGTHVTFLDSDDLMHPTRVERQLALLSERSCGAVVVGADCATEADRPFPQWLAERPYWQQGPYLTSVLAEIADVRAIRGFDESLSIGEDIDLVIRLRGSGVSVVATDEILTTRRFFGDNITWDLVVDGREMRDALRRHIARQRAQRA